MIEATVDDLPSPATVQAHRSREQRGKRISAFAADSDEVAHHQAGNTSPAPQRTDHHSSNGTGGNGATAEVLPGCHEPVATNHFVIASRKAKAHVLSRCVEPASSPVDAICKTLRVDDRKAFEVARVARVGDGDAGHAASQYRRE